MDHQDRVVQVTVITGCLLVLLSGTVSGCASDPSSRRAVKPRFSERMEQVAVAGTVAEIGGDYLAIRQANGELERVHVDDRTKMDRVTKGDRVKAYVNQSTRHASTVQRVH